MKSYGNFIRTALNFCDEFFNKFEINFKKKINSMAKSVNLALFGAKFTNLINLRLSYIYTALSNRELVYLLMQPALLPALLFEF